MKRASLVVGAASLNLLIGTGVVAAWACTPQPRSFSMKPEAAAAGSVASVVGQGVPAGSPVQVRWDDVRGQIIGSATADDRGQFQASVTIPQGAPGVHTVVFSAGDPNQPATTGVGRLAFKLGSADGPAERAVAAWGSDGPANAGASGTGHNDLAVGIGILGFGTVALAGASALAVVGRRRSRAGSA